MFLQAVLVLVLYSDAGLATGAVGCPFERCVGSFYSIRPSTLNHGDCVTGVTGLERCLQNSLKQDDVCQKCRKWEFNRFVWKNYGQFIINRHCFIKQCKKNDIDACLKAHLQNIITFYDTTKIYDFISCIGNWNPELDHKVCLNGLYYVAISDDIDPIAVSKQLLMDIKEGCDPVMPAVKCRQHLAPVHQWPHGSPFEEYRKGATKAIDDTLVCMQTTIKKYPCKTLEGLLSSNVSRDAITQALVRKHIDRDMNWEGYRSYVRHCGNASDIPSFFRK